MNDEKRVLSRFATQEEALSDDYLAIAQACDAIVTKYDLPDHDHYNRKAFPWALSHLQRPTIYASRIWEYAFAVDSADLTPGMRCLDVGGGMSAFAIYLKEVQDCESHVLDPDVFQTLNQQSQVGFGVTEDFGEKVGVQFTEGGMESIPYPDNHFDRVFCISVIEHLPAAIAQRGMQEMARIVKPGGRVIITVDMMIDWEMNRPLDLIWSSGLVPYGQIDLRWPEKRYSISPIEGVDEPADVFGFTLIKEDRKIESRYTGTGGESDPKPIDPHTIPLTHDRVKAEKAAKKQAEQQAAAATRQASAAAVPLSTKVLRRVRRAAQVLVTGKA